MLETGDMKSAGQRQELMGPKVSKPGMGLPKQWNSTTNGCLSNTLVVSGQGDLFLFANIP